LKNSAFASAVFSGCLLFLACPLAAQELSSPADTRVAFVRVALLAGRTGTALGPSGSIEINPFRYVGFCAFAAQSDATSDPGGGRAHDWDFSTGACVTGHTPLMKGFMISPFLQFEYLNNHERFIMAEANGAIYRDGADNMRRQWTFGSQVDRAIVRNGPRWALRIGRNIGKGPSSSEAGGLYFVGGLILPLDHPKLLARSLGFGRSSDSRN